MSKETTTTNNNNILYVVIVVLVIIIALLAGYMIGTSVNSNQGNTNGTTPTVVNTTGEGINVTIIDDKRCTTCGTDQIVAQIKQVPFLMQANFEEKDFSSSGIEDYLKENEITSLPAIIFDTNILGDGGTMAPYLTPLSGGDFSLQIGSTFDPFQERSEKGFLILDEKVLSSIEAGAYIKGNLDGKIMWLEYSELECPFCAKLHNAPTIDEVFEKYTDNIQMIFQHYPLDFHANAKPGAEVLECFGEQNGGDAFYSLIEKSFSEENSSKSFLIDEAVKLGADKTTLETCVDSGKYSQKIDNQMTTGQSVFGVTGTPGNVLINVETGEYEVISGAYPTSSFVDVIDRLLQ